jgi:hypothetical protein
MKDLVLTKAPPPPPRWQMWLLAIGVAITVLLLFNLDNKGSPVRNFTTNKVSTTTITSAGSGTGSLRGGGS